MLFCTFPKKQWNHGLFVFLLSQWTMKSCCVLFFSFPVYNEIMFLTFPKMQWNFAMFSYFPHTMKLCCFLLSSKHNEIILFFIFPKTQWNYVGHLQNIMKLGCFKNATVMNIWGMKIRLNIIYSLYLHSVFMILYANTYKACFSCNKSGTTVTKAM